jgi:hypothetical protein
VTTTTQARADINIKMQVPKPLKDTLNDYCAFTGDTLASVTRRALNFYMAAERKAGNFNAVDCKAEV